MKFKLPHLPKWLEGFLGIVLLFRIPSFFEPYYYGDEAIYLTLGQGIRRGLTLYKDLHDNKPPLLYIIAAIAGNEFWFKIILAGGSLITIVLFWKLIKTLFEKNARLQMFSTVTFGFLTTLPLLEGNIANAENFMIGFSILAFLLLFAKKLTNKKVFLAGLAFGVAALFKIPAAFEAPAIVVFWLITTKSFKKDFLQIVKKSVFLFSGFAAPILLTFVWYWLKGALPQYVTAAFLQNIGYLSSWRPGDVQKPFLVRNLPLLTRALTVLGGILLLTFFRKRLSKQYLFVCLWILFAAFGVTLSERPYPHYLLQVAPAGSIALGMLLARKNIEQVLVLLPLTLVSIIPVYYHYYHYSTIKYYRRFIRFTLTKDSNTYLKSFAKNISMDYEIADFLAKSTSFDDRVFIWDPDAPNIYALSKTLPPIKYVADYHIMDYSTKEAVATQISQRLPKFIIISSKDGSFSELNPLLIQKYILIQQIQDAEIFLRTGIGS